MGEVRKFWDATDTGEVKRWASAARPELVDAEIQTITGDWIKAVAPADIEARLERLSPPTSRLRILNPFDPVIRDRNRLARLFGFDYRVEMFVPAAKRIWGYYVFPILEGHRFVGRIEIKADRQESILTVLNFWPEEGVSWTGKRHEKLEAELARMARFVGIAAIDRKDREG